LREKPFTNSNGFSFGNEYRMEHHEIEIKLDLSNETNYRNVVNILSSDSVPVKQENHFFDTDQKSLSDAGWALRIRKEADRAFITLKGPKKAAVDNLAIRDEYEEKIDTTAADRYIDEGMESPELPNLIAERITEACKGERLRRILSFVNYRLTAIRMVEEEAVEIAIDRTEFADGSVDFELEAELSDKSKYKSVKIMIEDILYKVGVPVVFQNKSKLARALNKIEKKAT
jgi:uncharacterized protein YjbK